MNNKIFTEKLVAWYSINKRNLPWRHTRDPFKIWLSEVILQQTRVSQGLPYFQQFVDKYQNVNELAAAEEQQVLRLWQGLGYYSRARNLHRCAKTLAENFDGKFPKEYKSLLKLPGIGKYTAAAIASFAFKEKVAVVDGNVYRVLSRIFGIDEDIATGKGQKVFEEWAGELIPEKDPDTYNQAIMEFGAMHCTPKSPDCQACIFNVECYARKYALQDKLPVKSKKIKIQNRYFHYFVFRHRGKMIMKKRSANDIWKGLYDYPMVESQKFEDFDLLHERDDLLAGLSQYIKGVEVSPDYKHILTHRRLFARFFTVELRDDVALESILPEPLYLFDQPEVHILPKPVLVSRYLNDTIF